jgi:D-alanyl-D-alanine carboxypeptidase (penicillin-binding protein 5/6)
MNRSTSIACMILISLVVLPLGLPMRGLAAPRVTATTRGLDAVAHLHGADPPPALTAQSAVLMQADTGAVLWGLDQAARHSMASTAKMMTALVTIGLADLEEIAVVDASHLTVGSTAGLQPREQISIRALLHTLLIPSDNAAGLVLADYVGRTYLAGGPNKGVKAFVRAMNKRAQQMGLTNTRYESPFGWTWPDER